MFPQPDFTIGDDAGGTTRLWEHDGLKCNDRYRLRVEAKLKWYAEQGIKHREEGGGESASLVIACNIRRGNLARRRTNN